MGCPVCSLRRKASVKVALVLIASLFNLYTENIRREVLEPLEPGESQGQFDLFSIISTLEPDLRYADDSVLLSNSKDGFQQRF